MNSVPSAIKAAPEPQVNLLPPEVTAKRARGRQRGVISVFFFAFICLLVGGVFWATSKESEAKQNLQEEIDKGIDLTEEIATYGYVLTVQTELAYVRDARVFVGSFEVDTLELLGSIVSGLPFGTKIDTVTWSVLSVLDIASLTPDPLATPDIGSIALSGSLDTYSRGAELEEYLNGIPGLSQARITAEQRQDSDDEEDYYVFQGTVRVTALAFTGRFGTEWLADQAVSDATEALNTSVILARAAENAANEDLLWRQPGAEQALEEATATLEARVAEFRQFEALSLLVTATENEVAELEVALAEGEEDAESALADARAKLAELSPVLFELANAINTWDAEESSLRMVKARIAAAEDYVDDMQQWIDDAEDWVARGLEGAEEMLEDFEARALRAEEILVEEQSYLSAAEEAEADARAALDLVFEAAAEVAPTQAEVDEETS